MNNEITEEEMKALNKSAGYHFFDEGTKEFFSSEILTAAKAPYYLFITKEQTGFDTNEKAYTVRQFNPKTYGVDEVSEFLQFNSLEEARQWLQTEGEEEVEKFYSLEQLKRRDTKLRAVC